MGLAEIVTRVWASQRITNAATQTDVGGKHGFGFAEGEPCDLETSGRRTRNQQPWLGCARKHLQCMHVAGRRPRGYPRSVGQTRLPPPSFFLSVWAGLLPPTTSFNPKTGRIASFCALSIHVIIATMHDRPFVTLGASSSSLTINPSIPRR